MTFTTRMKRKIRRNLKRAPRGGNGIYIQLSSKRGIKILRHCEYKSFEELIRYDAMRSMYQEAAVMKRAKVLYPYIPNCYGVRMLKVDSFYTIGIIIQHLGNKRIGDVLENYPSIIVDLERTFWKLGINHHDMHANNVMYFRGKYWVIDFGYVTITRKR
jgi:tRNA A-37 threonylcarbamoyl transferase component Bud32